MMADNNQEHSIPETENKLFTMELFISTALRVGVTICWFFLLIGLIWLAVGNQRQLMYPNAFIDIWHSLLLGKGFAIIDLGLLILILTPVFRVAASIILFWHEKDHHYSFITVFVLCVLIISFMLGKVG